MTERNIDALIAERVMGWKDVHCYAGFIPFGEPPANYKRVYPPDFRREPVPSYSTDPVAADALLRHLTEPRTDPEDKTRGWSVVIASSPKGCGCRIARYGPYDETVPIFTSSAPSWTLALCQAALKAVDGE